MRSAFLLLLVVGAAFASPLPVEEEPIEEDSVLEQAEVLSLIDTVWCQTVTIGSSQESFNVAIDTMSGFLYVPDKTCKNCNDGNVFDSSQSTTYHDMRHSFSEPSHFGFVNGEIGQDTVVLGDSSNRSVTVPRATFGQVQSISGTLFPGIDGILGLAFRSTSPNGGEPVFEVAIREHVVDQGIFVIWLEDQGATSDLGTHGVIYYGNNDPLHCKLNETHHYPLSSAHYFQFTTPSVSFRSYTYTTRTQTVIDSLSPYIAAPRQFITNVLSQLGLAANTQLPAVVPCNTAVNIAFNFQQGTENVTDVNLLAPLGNGSCTLLLVQRGNALGNQDYFGLGQPFLRGRCTFFEYQNQRIGFGPPKSHGGEHDTTTASPMGTMAMPKRK